MQAVDATVDHPQVVRFSLPRAASPNGCSCCDPRLLKQGTTQKIKKISAQHSRGQASFPIVSQEPRAKSQDIDPVSPTVIISSHPYFGPGPWIRLSTSTSHEGRKITNDLESPISREPTRWINMDKPGKPWCEKDQGQPATNHSCLSPCRAHAKQDGTAIFLECQTYFVVILTTSRQNKLYPRRAPLYYIHHCLSNSSTSLLSAHPGLSSFVLL